MSDLLNRGIHEVWLGVESADPNLRDLYGKPKFTNEEVLDLTAQAHKYGINMCWYLVDSKDDTTETRLANYNFIREGQPHRIRIWNI
jgi:hypothetical protein